MKDAYIGQYLLWENKPAKIVGEVSERQVMIEMIEDEKCKNCDSSLGKKIIHAVVSSNYFQEGAKRIETIIDDDSLIIE